MKTLKDIMPKEFADGEYDDSRAFKFKDVEVIAKHTSKVHLYYSKWPGKHKNVFFWVELANGYAVGWNENSSRGWTFPVHKM